MFLENIKLNNIRSFLDEKVEFPNGITLLTGDIGSGKTSVLLAIDFALFGIRRGTLSGNALLRNGKDKGFVELKFRIDDKEVVIKRTLKRSKETVVQESGIISVNNETKELTPQELRQAILDLLNYPQEMLTKSKDLIYRFTVYTPQEEMRRILYEKKEGRLDTLRKVFGIDKYKRVKDNTRIFSSKIRDKGKEIQGRIFDLDKLKEEKKVLKERINELEGEVKLLEPRINEVNSNINIKKEDIKNIEDEIEKLSNLRNQLSILENEVNNKVNRKKNIKKNLENLEININKLREEVKDLEVKDLSKELEIKENNLENLRSKLNNLNEENSSLKTRILHSEDIINKIKDLDNCPVCKQKVDDNHRKEVTNKENEKIQGYGEILSKNELLNKKINSDISIVNEELSLLRENNTKYGANKVKKENLDEKEDLLVKLNEENLNIKKDIGEIDVKIDEITKVVESKNNLKESYDKLKEELEKLNNDLKNLEINKNSFDTEINNKNLELNKLMLIIVEKEKLKLNLRKLMTLKEFLDGEFSSLLDTIEKQIMLRLHNDFNELFKNWFNIMIEDENISIKLDEEFTPLIMQNNYDIDYEFLSGGEKTAAALAYRLSLNQVINNLISKIKTNDLIILDEPTDGFSDEQLDRMRLILDELDINQVIIVSHEAKIESFVENILRFKKENHVSKIEKYY